MSQRADIEQPPPQELALRGWAAICFEQTTALFDLAHKGLESFAEEELRPLGRALERAADLRAQGDDLVEVALHLKARRSVEGLVLPSERRLADAFARHCLGPEELDRHLRRTLDQVADALTRRHGQERALALLSPGIEAFGPVRREVLRRLAVGPALLRPARGPWPLATAPALWWVMWRLSSAARRRADVRAVVRDMMSMVDGGVSLRRGVLGHGRRLALLGGLSILGAAATSTVAAHALDVTAMYADMLDEIEELLLYGSVSTSPERSFGMGLLELVELLDEARE